MRVALFTRAYEAVCVVEVPLTVEEALERRRWRMAVPPHFDYRVPPRPSTSAMAEEQLVEIEFRRLVASDHLGRTTIIAVGLVDDPYRAEELAK